MENFVTVVTFRFKDLLRLDTFLSKNSKIVVVHFNTHSIKGLSNLTISLSKLITQGLMNVIYGVIYKC